MTYLAQWVSEIQEGETITAADIAVLARVQQALLASDKHHQQARDAARFTAIDRANAAEKVVVNDAVALVEVVSHYDHNETGSSDYMKRQAKMYAEQVNEAYENLRTSVAHLLAVEGAS